VRPPFSTVKQLGSDFRFELGLLRFGLIPAIASRSVLDDETGLLADTDRTTDVEDGPSPSDGEHFIFSRSSVN
jgi:hypothetical protein